MACKAIHFWTFSGLVGAFLDLGIAYFLVCAATLAFLATKFLGLFGLCLPCPCDGRFGNSNSDCWQRVLVDLSSERISSVQFSAKEKFPFDSIWEKDPNNYRRMGSERNHKDRHVDLEGEASCTSFSEARSRNMVGRDLVEMKTPNGSMNSPPMKEEGRFDFSVKGIASQRPRHSLRRRHKGAIVYGKSMSASSNDVLKFDVQDGIQSASSICKMGDDYTEDSFFSVNSGDGRDVTTENSLPEVVSHGLQVNERVFRFDGNECTQKKDALSAENFGCDLQDKPGFDGNERNAIRVLEQALEEEHTACAALYVELEKERSSAATAADEAMAMILRLQEEKASIEMEARQYQRILEEKTAYDAEEMNILKEILVRRERELHFLEKEADAYRQMIFGSDQMGADIPEVETTPGQKTDYSLYTSKFIGEKQEGENVSSTENEVPSSDSQNIAISFGEEMPIRRVDELPDSLEQGDFLMHLNIEKDTCLLTSSDKINYGFQEKGIILPVEENSLELLRDKVDGRGGLDIHGESIIAVTVGQEQEEDDNSHIYEGLVSNSTDICDGSKVIYPCDGEKHDIDQEKEHKNRLSPVIGASSCVHDVHVIDDGTSIGNKAGAKKSKELPVDSMLPVPKQCESPSLSLSRSKTEVDITKSSADIASGLPPTAHSHGKILHSDLRRNSLPAVDYERLKIGTEVEWLRERLKIIEEGRERLKFSAGYREKEKNELQLLEGIASQLREIQQLTDPGKVGRQASLPLSSTKVMSKKRCWRSASSLSVRRST